MVTDTDAWESPPTTVDDGTLTKFTVTSGKIQLDTVTDRFEAIQLSSPCRVEIRDQGETVLQLTCTVPGQRVFYNQGVPGMIYIPELGERYVESAHFAGYAELSLQNDNAKGVHHVRRSDGQVEHRRQGTSNALYTPGDPIVLIWNDVMHTYRDTDCPYPGHYSYSYTITTTDGWSNQQVETRDCWN